MKVFYLLYEELKVFVDKFVCEVVMEGVLIVFLYLGIIYGFGLMIKGNFLVEMVCVFFIIFFVFVLRLFIL